jgi:hypothetical protein
VEKRLDSVEVPEWLDLSGFLEPPSAPAAKRRRVAPARESDEKAARDADSSATELSGAEDEEGEEDEDEDAASPRSRRRPEPKLYALRAVVRHVGARAEAGHYVADVRDTESELWTRFDDDLVTAVDGQRVLGGEARSQAYLLLYERMPAPTPSPPPPPK